jgi:hypothetical protein
MSTESPHEAETPDPSSTDTQKSVKDYPLSARIIGGFLRFFGMILIIGAVMFWLIGAQIGHPFPGLPIVMALIGAVMHFGGRKVTPGMAGASASGAILAAVVAIFVLWVFGQFWKIITGT